MHELSLCQAIVDTVHERAAGRPLHRIDVRIGYLRQVVPDSLLFSWEVLTAGTDLEGCALVVEHVPAVIRCRGCGTTTELDRPILLCPRCQGSAVDVVAGDELLIASMDVVEDGAR